MLTKTPYDCRLSRAEYFEVSRLKTRGIFFLVLHLLCDHLNYLDVVILEKEIFSHRLDCKMRPPDLARLIYRETFREAGLLASPSLLIKLSRFVVYKFISKCTKEDKFSCDAKDVVSWIEEHDFS